MWQTAIRSSGEIRPLSNAQFFCKCISQYNMHIIRFVITGKLGYKGDSMSGGSSLTQDVYQRLRGDLLACRLMPGQKLKIEELCVRFGAGSSAVREALSRLAADGFVGLEPQRGFRVTPLSFAELRDLTNVRCEIEGFLHPRRHRARRHRLGDQSDRGPHRLSKTPERDPQDLQRYNDAFALAHTAFHQAVVGACARVLGCCASATSSSRSTSAIAGCRGRLRASNAISRPSIPASPKPRSTGARTKRSSG